MIVAVSVASSGCQQATTEPMSAQVEQRRAQWTALRPVVYQYDLQMVGFFIAYEGKHIRLVVRDGVVQSATDLATSKPIAGDASEFPTIDGLFDRAAHAALIGSLVTLSFDPTLGYPTEIRVTGVPDGAGTYSAGSVRPAGQ